MLVQDLQMCLLIGTMALLKEITPPQKRLKRAHFHNLNADHRSLTFPGYVSLTF